MTLVHAAAGGIRWTSLSMLLVTAAQMARLIVLGRILSPEEFGLFAMMLVVTGFIELLGQMGLGEAIIQRPNPTRLELSSLYWLNIASGILLFGVLLFATPVIAALYSTRELTQFVPWIALIFLISPWGAQFKALLQKRLCFKPLAIVESFAAIIGTIFAIVLAYQELGVWSLIWGQIAQSTTSTLALASIGWKQKMLPSFVFRWSAVRPYLSFGMHLLGSNLLNYFNSRVDQLVVGALLGPQKLGYYSMAFNLVLQPVSRINPVLTQVAFPILTKVRSDKQRLKRGYLTMLAILTSVNAPVLIGVAVLAPILIPALLGDNWLPIVSLVQVLALFSLIRSSGNAGGSLVLACGRADMAFYWNLILFVIVPLAIILGSQLAGLQGIAWSLLVMQILLLFAWYGFVVRRLVGDCFFGYIGAIFTPVFFALPMVAALIITEPFLSSIVPVSQIIIEVIIGGSIYVGLFYFLKREFVREQVALFFGKS